MQAAYLSVRHRHRLHAGDRLFTGSSVTSVTFNGDAPTFRFMPSSSIPDHGTFEGASNLWSVTIKGKNGAYNTDSYGIIYNKDMTKLVLVPQGKTSAFNVASTCTTIGDYAFYNCKKLKISTLPSRLTKVGSYGFGFCEGITAMTIPNSVTQLNYSAFYGCSNLTSLTIGTGLKSIGSYAFENTGLTTQYIPSTVTSIASYAFGYNYADSTHTRNSSFTSISGYPDSAAQTYAKNNNITFNSIIQYSISNDEVTIEKYTGSDTSLTIPATIEGKPVTKIKGYAFNGSSITSVVLPSSMTKIHGYAFYGANSLTSITIPSSVTSIGEYAFEFCTSLKSFTVPATVKSIANGAFYGCTSLASITLKDGLTTIKSYVFLNTALTSVTIPKTVTSIGIYSFGYNYIESTYSNVDGFKMTGYVDTAAETYANNTKAEKIFKLTAE